MTMILSLIIWILIGTATAYYANRRGRDPYLWFALGILLGIFGILLLLILPSVKNSEEGNVVDGGNSSPVTLEVVPTIIVDDVTKEWFFIDKAGQQQGPVGLEVLNERWADGSVGEKTFVWSEGMPEWKRVEDVKELNERLKTKG